MDKAGLVSVILPVHNGEGFVRRTIESILEQTYSDLELIIVDDASTDNSLEIINSYQDKRIRSVHLDKNQNVCFSSTVAYEMARGEYCALIGHDDIWDEQKLEKQIAYLKAHPECAVCFSRCVIVDEEERDIGERVLGLKNRFDTENMSSSEWIVKLFLNGNYFCAPGALIRKAVLERTGFYKLGLVQLQDYELWLRILADYEVHILDEPLLKYRKFLNSTTNLSAYSEPQSRRDRHEFTYIQSEYLKSLSNQRFTQCFRNLFLNKAACAEGELECEKGLLLYRTGNPYWIQFMMKLIENKECRERLENTYGISLKSFYEMNSHEVSFENNGDKTANQKKEEAQNKRVDEILALVDTQDFSKENLKKYTYAHFAALLKTSKKLEGGMEYYLEISKMIYNANVERLKKQEKIVVAFLANYAATWCCGEVYTRMEASGRFEPYVVVVPNFIQGNVQQEEYNETLRAMKNQNMRVLETVNWDTMTQAGWEQLGIDPDIIFNLTPWPLQRGAFYIEEFTLDKLNVFIPYGITGVSNKEQTFPFQQYNQISHNLMWKNFATCREEVELANEYCDIGSYNVVFSGYPKMDTYYRNETDLPLEEIWKLPGNADGEKIIKIIYAPHHSLPGTNEIALATFQKNGKFMYEMAKKYQNTSWIVRPHPQLGQRCVQAGIFASIEEYKEYLEKWDELPNAKVCAYGKYDDYFKTSDGMIMDCGSFLGEYLYVDKPLLFLRSEGAAFNRVGERVIQTYDVADGGDFEGIEAFITDNLIKGQDLKAGLREGTFAELFDYVKYNQKNASQFIVDYLTDVFR